MTVTVAELVDAEISSVIVSELGDLVLGEESMEVAGTMIPVTDDSMGHLTKHLGIPATYIKKLPQDLRDANLQYWIGRDSNSPIAWEIEAPNNTLVGVYKADHPILLRSEVVKMAANVMAPTDIVRGISIQNGVTVLDVSTPTLAIEPRVGDFTEGGVRFKVPIAPQDSTAKPSVSSYMVRLDCLNGMTHQEEWGRIRIKGLTVTEVIEEMEIAAQALLSDLVPTRLEQFAGLTEEEPDNPEQYIHRLSREYGLPEKMETSMINRVPELEHRTAYDLVNLMSGFQHEVSDSLRNKLQNMAGSVAVHAGERRCQTCFSLLEQAD